MSQPASDPLSGRIHTIRGQRVILDADLARLYGTTTKVFNQSIKRNVTRFPGDFAFQLTAEEFEVLRSQIATTSGHPPEGAKRNRSQIVTGSKARHRNIGYQPWAFTEHGAVMAANVLRSPRAVEMSVYVVRAFIKQRELLMAQSDVLKKLAQMDAKLLKHDDALRLIWRELQPLLNPPPAPPKPQIGFNVKEESSVYRIQKKAKKSRA